MRDTVAGAFVTAGADHLGGLGVDQLLEYPLGELANKIGAIANAERVKQFGQDRITPMAHLLPVDPSPKPHHSKGLKATVSGSRHRLWSSSAQVDGGAAYLEVPGCAVGAEKEPAAALRMASWMVWQTE